MIAIVATSVVAPPAFAADIVYFDGSLTPNQLREGPRHSLTRNSARKQSPTLTSVCVVTRRSGSSSWDSEPRCTFADNGLAQHSFCGCHLRHPIVFTGSAGTGTGLRARLEY